MSIIDERGRLFGRLNVVDAAVALLLIAIVPVGYGAYLLFRAPVPKLTGLAPDAFIQGPNQQTAVHGENLRPYMRVSFGDKQGQNFLFVDPQTAVIPLPDLPPGQYDVVLYDYARENGHLKYKDFKEKKTVALDTSRWETEGSAPSLTHTLGL